MRQSVLVPGAIILAGLILAISIFLLRSGNEEVPTVADLSLLRPVSPEEHIVGNPTASVVIIEYSDIDCAYCKQFQRTMAQIMTDYGPGENVAWVYRHFPLVHLHPDSGTHAEASECVATLGYSDAFFRFIDLMQASTPGTNEFDPENYSTYLPQVGVEEAAFDECLKSGRYVKKVEADLQNAIQIGATATPYTVILIKGAEPLPIKGALPYEAMKEVVDEALSRVVQ